MGQNPQLKNPCQRLKIFEPHDQLNSAAQHVNNTSRDAPTRVALLYTCTLASLPVASAACSTAASCETWQARMQHRTQTQACSELCHHILHQLTLHVTSLEGLLTYNTLTFFRFKTAALTCSLDRDTLTTDGSARHMHNLSCLNSLHTTATFIPILLRYRIEYYSYNNSLHQQRKLQALAAASALLQQLVQHLCTAPRLPLCTASAHTSSPHQEALQH
jgi:hypothetical protein